MRYSELLPEEHAVQIRWITTALVVALMFLPCARREAWAYDYIAPVPFITTVANFDPANGVMPFPNDLLLSGTTDLTLNIPVNDPNDYADPLVALNTLDGFSTSAPWSLTFSTRIAPASVVGGASVRLFEVTLSGPGGAVVAVNRELQSPQEFVATLSPSDSRGETLAIVLTTPLKQLTSYMAVVTRGVTNVLGIPTYPSPIYHLAQSSSPLCVNGKSKLLILSASQACRLEPLRQLVNAQEAAARSAGVAADSIVMSWVATTQSITPTFTALENIIQQAPAATTHLAATDMTLGDLGTGLPPIADIYIGTIDLPYYLTAPGPNDCIVTTRGASPCPPLTSFWHAAPGAYVPPFDQAGLDPTSTFVTYANPIPVPTSTQTVPLLMTIPNAASGQTKPASGWPLVIFQHGITGDRTDMLAIAGTLAAQGFAVVAMDLPLHGVTDRTNQFYIGNTPFAALGARERTFDIGLISLLQSNASGSNRWIDPSGIHFITLTSLLTSRDNLREAEADLLTLSHAVSGMHYTSGTDFDTAKVSFVGHSLGSIAGTVFLGIDPNVHVGVINVAGGGIAHLLEASQSFGPLIKFSLALACLLPGTPNYNAFVVATQTVVDSSDPINWPVNSPLLSSKSLLLQEVIGDGSANSSDQVIPNSVPGAPLSGTEPLVTVLGLSSISQTATSPDGIRGVVRFLKGTHGSLLDPTRSAAVTTEMQGEATSLLVSGGTTMQVANPSVILGTQ
ncbi:MAG: hypothetical protein LBQ20_00925 [Rhodanobacter sp.]|nr:hypothetical protein [Rhodanobacter sp.]